MHTPDKFSGWLSCQRWFGNCSSLTTIDLMYIGSFRNPFWQHKKPIREMNKTLFLNFFFMLLAVSFSFWNCQIWICWNNEYNFCRRPYPLHIMSIHTKPRKGFFCVLDVFFFFYQWLWFQSDTENIGRLELLPSALSPFIR